MPAGHYGVVNVGLHIFLCGELEEDDQNVGVLEKEFRQSFYICQVSLCVKWIVPNFHLFFALLVNVIGEQISRIHCVTDSLCDSLSECTGWS